MNGHEWAKRQKEKKGIADEALDNGFLSCADAGQLRRTGDSFTAEDIDLLFRKWLARIPLPLRPEDRAAGFDWSLSIWQMEVSLTQMRASQPAHQLQELRSETGFQRRPEMPDGRNLP